MARRRRKSKDKAGEASQRKKGLRALLKGTQEEASRAFDRLTLALTLVGVCTIAVFTGYLVGQYAVRWVASPLIVTERAQDPGTRLAEDRAAAEVADRSLSPSPAQGSSSPAASAPVSSSAAGADQPGASTASPAPERPQPSSPSQPGQPAAASASRPSVQPPGAGAGRTRRTIYRVQVGRFANRDDAAKVADALKAENPPVPDAWVLFDNSSGQYRVQAGAFSNRQRAQDFVDQLVAMGYDAYIAQ